MEIRVSVFIMLGVGIHGLAFCLQHAQSFPVSSCFSRVCSGFFFGCLMIDCCEGPVCFVRGKKRKKREERGGFQRKNRGILHKVGFHKFDECPCNLQAS